MFQVARLVGSTLKEVIADSSDNGQTAADQFSASVIVGGQIKDGQPTIFMIYPQGNFIEITGDTPFFQIGETKYGKPILVRAYDADMSFDEAVKLLLVSFDSTVKSNLSVGLPFDLQIYEGNSFASNRETRIDETDEIYQAISSGWGDALKEAFQRLPSYKI
jgi:putative proteasome-type protease